MKIRLVLFIVSQTAYSERAIQYIHRICEKHMSGEYILTIIDVLERPDLAEEHRVFATPTLIRENPPPKRRLIGDLSDSDKVLDLLEIVDTGSADYSK